MQWLQLSLKASKEYVDSWGDALNTAGAVAITVAEDQQQIIYELRPGDTQLWDHANLVALFPIEYDPELIKLQLAVVIPSAVLAEATWQNIAEEDWLLKWQDNLQPMLFGNKIWVCPSWCKVPDPDAINIILDPEMAFGTGSHPTTAMCLDWVAQNISPGDVVVDYGCGSGILAIAAAKLGASKVIGVDIDPVSLEVSDKNAKINNIQIGTFSTYLPPDTPNIKADVVIANILAGPLSELAPTLAALCKPGGKLILSGLLAEQAEAIKNRYSQWFKDFAVTQQEDWIRVTAVLSVITP